MAGRAPGSPTKESQPVRKGETSEALASAWRDSLNTMASAASAVGTGVEGMFRPSGLETQGSGVDHRPAGARTTPAPAGPVSPASPTTATKEAAAPTMAPTATMSQRRADARPRRPDVGAAGGATSVPMGGATSVPKGGARSPPGLKGGAPSPPAQKGATATSPNTGFKGEAQVAAQAAAQATAQAMAGLGTQARSAGRATLNLLSQPLQAIRNRGEAPNKGDGNAREEPEIDWLALNDRARELCEMRDRAALNSLKLTASERVQWVGGLLAIHCGVWRLIEGRDANYWPLILAAGVSLFVCAVRDSENADRRGVEWIVQKWWRVRRASQSTPIVASEHLEREKRRKAAKLGRKATAGSSLSRASRPGEPMTWDATDPTLFRLRGPNYLKDKKKQPSPPSLYAPFACDLLRASEPEFELARYLSWPDKTELEAQLPSWMPRFVIQNMWFPATPPPLLGAPPEPRPDGAKGYLVACYWRVSEDAARVLTSTPELEWPPHLRLWKRYATSAASAPVLNGCLKGVASVFNLNDSNLGLPRLVKQYNAKPVLMAASAVLGGERKGVVKVYRDDHSFEFGLNVLTDFAAMSNHALHSMRPTFPKLVLDLGWLVEGRSTDDLPEGLVACMRVNKVDLDKAQDIDVWLKPKAD